MSVLKRRGEQANRKNLQAQRLQGFDNAPISFDKVADANEEVLCH
jgi:hypothetical protein